MGRTLSTHRSSVRIFKLFLSLIFRREGLFGAQQVQKFYRDVDETLGWIGEKDAALSNDDYGRDLNSVQALQRRHETIERDLAALESKVRHLKIE